MLTASERNKLPLEDFKRWRVEQEAAAFRQAYNFVAQGEAAVRQAGYASVSHYVSERRMALEKAHMAWERANPA